MFCETVVCCDWRRIVGAGRRLAEIDRKNAHAPKLYGVTGGGCCKKKNGELIVRETDPLGYQAYIHRDKAFFFFFLKGIQKSLQRSEDERHTFDERDAFIVAMA